MGLSPSMVTGLSPSRNAPFQRDCPPLQRGCPFRSARRPPWGQSPPWGDGYRLRPFWFSVGTRLETKTNTCADGALRRRLGFRTVRPLDLSCRFCARRRDPPLHAAFLPLRCAEAATMPSSRTTRRRCPRTTRACAPSRAGNARRPSPRTPPRSRRPSR